MDRIDEVKEILKETLPKKWKENMNPIDISLELSKQGIAILGVDMRMNDGFKPFLHVQFLDEDKNIVDGHFDLVEVDGRPIEEIQKEMAGQID